MTRAEIELTTSRCSLLPAVNHRQYTESLSKVSAEEGLPAAYRMPAIDFDRPIRGGSGIRRSLN